MQFHLDDWRVDGYRWFQYGTKKLPMKEPVIKKVYFATVLQSGTSAYDKRFRRQAFFSLDDNDAAAVLVHYLGDESIAEDFPHGNSKCDSDRPHHRTYPSSLAKYSSVDDLPCNVYKKAISRCDCPQPVISAYLPKNSRQLTNLQQKERQKSRLTHDGLYNLHELAYDLNGFVKIMTTYPDLVIICGLTELIKELDMVLQLESERPQLLSYDTTFQLGDFYLSPLLFRHTLFTTSPVIPVLFLIHERKFQHVHEMFMKYLHDSLPSLVRNKLPMTIPIVTDEEVGINMVSFYLLF